jgi:hypothetical protein
MKPAHDAFITKQGEGSNLDRAVRDAVLNLFKDTRLKGKKADNILPVKLTVALISDPVAEARRQIKSIEASIAKMIEQGVEHDRRGNSIRELQTRVEERKELLQAYETD